MSPPPQQNHSTHPNITGSYRSAAVKAARPRAEARAADAKTFLGRRRWRKLHKSIKALLPRRRSDKRQIGTVDAERS